MRRIASSLALTLIALTLAPSTPLANAATVGFSWSGGVLTVTGTGSNDSLTVTCSAGSVSVNGSTDFGFGLVPCASVAAITLLGAGGDDTLNTTPANPANFTSPITTTLKGGPGNDTLSASTGDDTLKGGTGNDTLTGSFGNETIGGGKGTDILKETGFAFGTGDTIMLTDTTMSGDLGSDTLSSIEAADITGTSMADVMSSAGFSGPVFFDGDAGADSITGGPGDDTLMAGNGGDTIVGGSGNDTIVPGPGDDSAQGGSGLDMLAEQTDASTTLTATTMTASTTGTDTFSQMERAYIIAYVAAPVTLKAGASPLDVALISGTGNDVLIGGSGDDMLMPLAGTDSVQGGAGTDSVVNMADAHQSLTNTTLVSGGETDTLTSIERAILEGGPSDNAIFASSFSGPVTLRGEGGERHPSRRQQGRQLVRRRWRRHAGRHGRRRHAQRRTGSRHLRRWNRQQHPRELLAISRRRKPRMPAVIRSTATADRASSGTISRSPPGMRGVWAKGETFMTHRGNSKSVPNSPSNKKATNSAQVAVVRRGTSPNAATTMPTITNAAGI